MLTTVLSQVAVPWKGVELSLIDHKYTAAANWWRYEYSKALHKMQMYQQHAAMLKYVDAASHPPPSPPSLGQGCAHCTATAPLGDPCCVHVAIKCAVCRGRVTGASWVCLECGHLGHLEHMLDWFRAEQVCPHPGCGCACRPEAD